MGREVDPSDIGKHEDLIKTAQSEMTKTDVLVCGECYQVHKYVEEFSAHKKGNCSQKPPKEFEDAIPKTWAYLLWKASYLKAHGESTNNSPWKIFEEWSKLDEGVRETWVVAGRTIQSFARMGKGNLHEMPVKITKTVVDSAHPEPKTYSKTEPKANVAGRQLISMTKVEETPDSGSKIVKKIIRPPVKLPANPVLLNKVGNTNKIAKRTIPDSETNETEDQTVEKILAKRFNPRRKEHEYLVKWENFTHDQNTWEPYTYLKVCPQMLDLFEKQLARQKEQRAAMAAAKQAAENKAKENSMLSNSFESSNDDKSPNRLARNSKVKAMDQVKQWIADNNETANAATNKRKIDISDVEFEPDEDEPALKVIKTESGSPQMNRLGQTGAVRIVSVNKQGTPTGISHKINGSKSPEKSTDVVITSVKERKPTGIVKKPGVTANPVMRGEAQVRVVQKGDPSVSGVVRINNAQQKGVQRMGPVRGPPPARQANVGMKPTITTRPAQPRNQPIRQIVSQSTKGGIAQRTSLSPQTQKTTVTRIIKSAPNSETKLSVQDQKIAALTRHGDLKITRKHMPSSSTQIPSTKLQQNIQEDVKESFQNNVTDSPPHEMTLCPITGKVLGQAEDEAVPLSNSEDLPESELKLHATVSDDAGLQQLLAEQEDGQPLLVTGEDGTIYQVAGKNEQGQTILIAQGGDGEQQCVYVASEENEEGNMMTLDNDVTEAMQNIATVEDGQTGDQYVIKQDPSEIGDASQQLSIATDSDSQDGQITAEVVQADLPSPGGTRKVVLLLPDGNFMMTEVSDEQYQSLNLVT